MEELKKVKRVIARVMPDAPHEVLLVLDANTGQNALSQVKAFDDALGLTGLTITKLDGTAKGGAIAAIARYKPIPVRFIGVGEGIDDLRPFDARRIRRRAVRLNDAAAMCRRRSGTPIASPAIIALSHVYKRYPGGFEALRDVSPHHRQRRDGVDHRPLRRRQVARCSS